MRLKFKDRWIATFTVIKSLFSKDETYDDISIQGDRPFIVQVQKALSLLEDRSPDGYRTVKENVENIFQCTQDTFTTFGKQRGAIALNVQDQTLTWVAGKLYYESKKISIYRLLRREGVRPKSSDYGYKKVADEHYRIMNEIGTEFEELKHLADWIEERCSFIGGNFLTEYQSTEDNYIARISKGIKTKEQLLSIISKALNFPDYFGMNWDALDECLRDLSWISQKDVIIYHEDFPLVNLEEQNIYLEVLSRAVDDWGLMNSHKLLVVFPKDLN